MIRTRSRLCLPALLALALFVAWLGVGAGHQHSGVQTCAICKIVQDGAADVPPPSSAAAPAIIGERPAAPLAVAPPAASLSLHWGRAPPSA